MFFTYDFARFTGTGGYVVVSRTVDAIRVQGVWLDIPHIESKMVSFDLCTCSSCVMVFNYDKVCISRSA